MTTHDALLAAVLAHPADDTARLVYADWLEENAGTVECTACGGTCSVMGTGKRNPVASKNQYSCPCRSGRVSDGRAERAEFIRVQVELARTKGCDECWDSGQVGPCGLTDYFTKCR